MSAHRTLRTIGRGVALALLLAPPVHARSLDLPVRVVGGSGDAAPAYLGDVLSVRLRPAAARDARAARARAKEGDPATGLGIAALDQAARALGGAWFESEFSGESPPPEGSTQADFTAFYLVHLPPGAGLAGSLDLFASIAEVESAEPIAVVPVSAVPNDSLWARSTWFFQSPSRRDLHAPEAWDLTTGDTSIVVAIIDTGLIPYHPEIGGREPGLSGNLWTNWSEQGGIAGEDDDGNGFVDDRRGWDFVNLAPGSDVRAGEDGYVADGDPNDFVGHGTAVAGLIGAITNNGSGIAGTVWQARLMPLRVGWGSNRRPTGEISLAYAAQAVRYATRMGARVINCSFSSVPLVELDLALTEATRAGVLVVVAAGNLGSPNAIGEREDVLCVAAVDRDDAVAGFSNLGPWVDVAAPGVSLATTGISRPGTDSLGLRQPGYAPDASGTSFAAPLGSGAAALVQSRRLAQGLALLDPVTLLLHLRESADDIADRNPLVSGYGTGRLNLARAVETSPASRVVRAGGRTVGAAVVMATHGGGTRIAVVTSDARLLILDGASGEALRSVALPAPPVSGLAAADLGAGVGVGMFAVLDNGRVAGYRPSGDALPGWPVPVPRVEEPSRDRIVLGDLDGDSLIDVVFTGGYAGVRAWHADGRPFPGFPRLGFEGVGSAAALADIDGRPGVEIVVPALDGFVHALRADGTDVPGWPTYLARALRPAAPVVTRFQDEPAPTVLITDGDRLRAVRVEGTTRFEVRLWGYPVQDPALADLDGDGSDEVVIASGPYLSVFDSTGAPTAGSGLHLEAQSFDSAPIVGPVAGGRLGIVLRDWRGLVAWEASGLPLRGYPLPGRAGEAPTLAELDADGATELIGGTGPDSLLYLYDLGSGSWDAPAQAWPTPRGNFARTGSRTYAPAIPPLDGAPPFAVTDLHVVATSTTSLTLRWTTPADPPSASRVTAYDLRWAPVPLDVSNFDDGTSVTPMPIPAAPGTPAEVVVAELAEGRRHYLALRSRDAGWNSSPLSNLLEASTERTAPAAVADLRVAATDDTSARLFWTATGDDGATGRPTRYRLAAALEPLDEVSFAQAPIVRALDATVTAGGEERCALIGLPRGKRLWFALKAEDRAGTLSPLSNVVSARIGIGGPLGGRPGVALASLLQPSRSPVHLYWQSAEEAEHATQSLEIYDLRGRRVRVFRIAGAVGGVEDWDGRDERGARVPAGLYFARLTSGARRATARIMLLP